MRFPLLLFVTACAGATAPAVTPKLSELPVEAERRDKVLDSSHQGPGPEQQPKTKKERKAETVAATAAAVVGWLMSDSENVTLGVGTPIDEGHLVDSPTRAPSRGDGGDPATARHELLHDRAQAHDENVDVPWIRLR